MSRATAAVLVCVLTVLAHAPAAAAAAKAKAPKPDRKPPAITHTPVRSASAGQTVAIRAQFKDESPVFAPTVYFRVAGARSFSSVPMMRVDGDVYEASLTAGGALEYFLEVYDELGNGPARSGSAKTPHRIALAGETAAPVAAAETAKPAAEDKEPPVIEHEPVKTLQAGAPLVVEARIVDRSPIFAPTVYVRAPGAGVYESHPMVGTAPQFGATVPVQGPVEYWIEAYDEMGNGPATAGGADKPFVVTLQAAQEVPAAALLPPGVEEEKGPPVYRRWWFVAGAGAVAAAAVATVVVATSRTHPYVAYTASGVPGF